MYQNEIEFLNIVSMVAAQYNCTIDDIDLDTRTIHLTCMGGKSQEIECAIAISDIFDGRQEEARFV
jgi:hypothetical protein